MTLSFNVLIPALLLKLIVDWSDFGRFNFSSASQCLFLAVRCIWDEAYLFTADVPCCAQEITRSPPPYDALSFKDFQTPLTPRLDNVAIAVHFLQHRLFQARESSCSEEKEAT